MKKRFSSKEEHLKWYNDKYAERRDAFWKLHPEYSLVDLYFKYGDQWEITEEELNEMAKAEGYDPDDLYDRTPTDES